MSAKTIRNALGLLQDDADNEQAWSGLSAAVGLGSEAASHGMSADELSKLFQAARRAHEARREYDAVARLLHMEAALSKGTPREVEAFAELARVLDEELLDDVRAVKVYGRILKLQPGDAQAEDALARSEAKRGKWRDLVSRYIEEAKTTGEASFKSSLLVSAAEAAFRYGRPALEKGQELDALVDEIIGRLNEAIEIDPKNRRAELLLERLYRKQERWTDLAQILETHATQAEGRDQKVSGFIRLARVFSKKLAARERAMTCYERVLELAPGHPEATSALVDFYTERERWDDLIALYDTQLRTGVVRGGEEVGVLLQIAMVQWKVKGRAEDAEPYFERLRKIEPSHPTMLGFFREWCTAHGENARLLTILMEAQRVMPESAEKKEVAREIARYAEEGANAAKAIEQWRVILRQDPNNRDAREALKRLYRQTGVYAPLADLLRQDLERIAQDDAKGRLPTLREIASLYREHLKNDAALVTVLTQIIALDASDIIALRELARVYETLGRWRDLLTVQMRVAELEPDVDTKAELYRSVARRWLEQFSNVQNAVEAYEKLHATVPKDREAFDKLKELYTKRRAYKALYELLEGDVDNVAAGPRRRDVLLEMAKLAAERLDRGVDAVKLYRRILEEDPNATEALDALEKQADREKDFATVASVLERRVELAADDATRLTVLQKLGAIYSDRLQEHAGAMRAWRRVLALSPGHAKALRVLRDSHLAVADYDGLTELYSEQHDWEGLAEVLSSAADKATDPDVKVELSYRAADVYADKLRAPERAFRAYERVLAARPNDKRAAAALVPLYEKDEKWARLPALYEVLLGHAADEDDRLALLGKLADVTGKHLQDKSASFAFARRAYAASPSKPGALATFEQNARAAGAWEEFAQAISARLEGQDSEDLSPEERRALRGKLAETYATELGMLDESVAIYRELVQEDERDESAVQTLDRILRGADRRDDLRWHFNLRVERANTAQKLDLLTEWALLEEDAFSDPAAAIALYRRILDVVPQSGVALRALARLLRAAGDPVGALEALERDRDQRSGAERSAREVEIAKLNAQELSKPNDALAAAKRALELTPNDPGAVEVVEGLLQVAETRASAAAVLEASYASTGKPEKQAEVLGVMIATAAAKEDRLALYNRLADVHEEKLGNAPAAFEVIARSAKEFPSELDVWDRLAFLANKTRKSQVFVDALAEAVPPTGATGLPPHVEMDLAERAATLYEEKLGDLDRAKPYLERILGREPANERAFSRLKQILMTREQWRDIEAMYENAVGAVPEVSRRAELLSEIALIAEEITAERPKAIAYYERILELDPLFEQAIRALDNLYAAEGRWESLAKLLVRRLETGTAEEGLVLKLRLGTIYFTRLSEHAAALDNLDEVLQADPANREATALVEKALEIPELRARAAGMLEAVYTTRDEVGDLVRVLEVRLEFATTAEDRRELLRRIADLRDDRLKEEQGAFHAYARLAPLDPADASARERLLEIGRRLGENDRAATVLTEAAAAAAVPQPRAEILTEVARIYERALNDPSRAEGVYREILNIDPTDASIALPAARSLESIYAAAGKNPELAEMLRVEVKLEDDGPARRELLGRLGELCEMVLDDPRGAIDAWTARLEDDPTDERALVALDRLYTRTSEWRALVDVLRARERHATEGPQRKELLTRIATTLADKLLDVPEAIVAYRAVVDEFGPEKEPLHALETLYEVAEKWQDLADTIEASLSLTELPADRLSLLARLGTVRQNRLEDVAGALEAYRQTLTLDPAHHSSRIALEGLLTHEEARRDAAAILRPLYEIDGEHEKLLRVLDIEVEYADSVSGRLALFGESSRIAEESLRNPGRAFDYVARGVREASSEAEASTWLERAERLAQLTGRHADHVALLRDVVHQVIDEELQLGVTMKIADSARQNLGDRELARTYYNKALEIRSDDRRALMALETLYEEIGDHGALLDILKRRAEAAQDDAERKALLFKQARLDDATLNDPSAAISVYEQILEMGFDPEAQSPLERLYTSQERWDDLIALYEREIALEATAAPRKATLHHQLGGVLERRTGDMARAFEEYENALRIDAQHAATVASLEALMGGRADGDATRAPGVASRAAEMLEAVYLARLDWRKVIETIDVRLATSEDPDDRRTLLRRLAKLYEEQGEDYKAALETSAKLLAEDVTDETTWAELERLGRVANAEPRLAQIFADELGKLESDEPATARLSKRTGELYEAQNDVERALVFYRRSYAFAPDEDEVSFEAIDRLLRRAERPAERVALYRGALEHRTEQAPRIATLHTIAQIQENELKDDAAAISTYRAALEIDETDGPSLETLSRLYARTERWRDLADHTRKRAEQSAAPDEESRFRLELGRLHEQRLDEVTVAIDEYDAVVGLVDPVKDPTGREAVVALEGILARGEDKPRLVEILRPIYEQADDWRKLVSLNDERLALAEGASDKVLVLRETARFWEERGNDRLKAFDAVRDAFVLDPEDGETREQIDRLAEATKRWDDLADAYEKGIAQVSDLAQKELLGALARVHDRRRDDPRKALEAWERLFKLDESDIAPLEEMDSLATLLSDWPTLVRVLAKKAELLMEDEQRASTWRRIGESRRDMLDDPGGAIDAYERALELEPDSAFTLDNLIDLYEAKNDAARLVELYRRRVELCGEDDEGLKFRLLVDAANRYELGLSDRREAIQLLNEALAVKPGDADVTRRLDSLYTSESMWPELLENLRLQAGASTEEGERRTLKKRIGALLAGELDDPGAALEAYREVLASGFHRGVVAAVRQIGEAREELRAESADILEPVLRGANEHAELADVLEMRLRAQTEPGDRARTLRAIAQLSEESLKDDGRAELALVRAMGEEPADAELHAEIERLASRLGREGWQRYADALGDRAATIFDAAITTDLYTRLGRVAEERLNDDVRAARAYVQAAERAGDTASILASLDRLYFRLGDARALADVLERRIAVDPEPAAQAEYYHRLALLQLRDFGEKGQGLATLRHALERVTDYLPSRAALEELLADEDLFDEAFEALEWVYRTLSLNEELARLYERKVTRAQGVKERVRARLDLSRVLEEQVRDAGRAQRAVEAALADDPMDQDVLAELERLAAATSTGAPAPAPTDSGAPAAGWAAAADALSRALAEARELSTANVSELTVRLATWRRDRLADPRGAEESFAAALKIDPDNGEILRSIEELQRVPGRERDLVETLRRRAKIENDPSAKRDHLREAKALAEGTVGDPALAEATLRELLAEDESDQWALEELTRFRETAGDHGEVVSLLLRRAEAAGGGDAEALSLKHQAATVATDRLNDRARAIALYEEILEQEPTDAGAASKLRGLLAQEGRHRELAKLLGQLIDVADSAEERARLRLDLAALQDTKFDAPRDAADTLRAILDEGPGHKDAVVALSQLLEKTGQDEELAELLNSQIERARERGDASAELTLQVRLGEVFERRLLDTGRALATYEAVLEREPNHAGALESVARLAEGRGAWDRAATALATLAAMATDASGVATALRLATVREHLGDADGVESALQRALELDARNAEVRGRLRDHFEKTKKWGELADLLVGDADLMEIAPIAAVKTVPGQTVPPPAGPVGELVRVLRRAAEIHLKERKSPADAIPVLERATEFVPFDRELLLVLGDAYAAAHRERDAAAVLERVIASFGAKRTKELAVYHHRLGRALGALGEREQALGQFDLAFKIDPGSVTVLKDLGVLAYETEDLDRAQKTFRALLLQRLDANAGISKGEVFYYLGEISAKQGDRAKAVQMFERAVENEPTLDRAKSKLAELKG